MKIAIKYLKRIILSLLAAISGYLLIALLLSISSTTPEKLNCERDKHIFISTNGAHLDIIIPKEDLKGEIETGLQMDEYVNYVSFGWGDKGFYLETPTWSDLKFSTAVKAMFLNSESAMHITNYQRSYNDWVKIMVCNEQLELMKSYIMDSFARDGAGQIIEIEDSGYSSYDTFYEAIGSYSFIHTCNFWVNRGLKMAQIETSIWSPFDKGVLYQINKHGKIVN